MTTTEPFLHQVHLHPSDTNNNVSREEEDMAMDEEDAEDQYEDERDADDDTGGGLHDGGDNDEGGGEPMPVVAREDSCDLGDEEEQQGGGCGEGGGDGPWPVGTGEDSCGAVLNLGGDVEHEAHQEWESIIIYKSKFVNIRIFFFWVRI